MNTNKYRLVIGDVISVPVKGTLQVDGGAELCFDFKLQMRRLPRQEFEGVIEPGSGHPVDSFVLSNTVGWSGQQIVLDEQGEPAAYSAEALDCMLTIVGMPQRIFQDYMQAMAISNTEAGRAKNSPSPRR